LSVPVKLKGKRSTGENYEVEIINIVLMLPRTMQSSLVTQMAIPFVSLCSNPLSLDRYMTLGISKLLFARIKGFSSTVTADWQHFKEESDVVYKGFNYTRKSFQGAEMTNLNGESLKINPQRLAQKLLTKQASGVAIVSLSILKSRGNIVRMYVWKLYVQKTSTIKRINWGMSSPTISASLVTSDAQTVLDFQDCFE